MSERAPGAASVRTEVDKILASPGFRSSERLSRFLRFVVEEALEGRGDQIKEYSVGVQVYDRPTGYDPRVDATVRVEASKLRARLAKYYEGEGRADAVVISIPKGGYTPVFGARRFARAAQIPLAVAAACVLAVALVYLWAVRRGAPAESLAVLPIENATGDPEVDYLSDGMTESLINSLASLPPLRVATRTKAFRYKGRHGDPQKAGGEMGVALVLTGKVQRRPEGLKLQVDLIRVADGSQLWGRQYDFSPGQVLAVEAAIRKEVAEKLRLSAPAPVKRVPNNTEAYHAYLRGRYFWNQRSPASLEKAIGYFQEAIRGDPTYAPAHAGLSEVYFMAAWYAGLAPSEALSKGRAAAETAWKLDDQSAEPHIAMGSVHRLAGDHAGSWKELSRAAELDPNHPAPHRSQGLLLMWLGRFEEATSHIQRGYELDPLSVIANINVGEVMFYSRQYDRAIEQYRKTVELDPHFFWTHERLGQAYEQKGMYKEAIAEYERAIELGGDARVVGGALGHAYARSGQRREAEKMLARLRDLSRNQYVPPYNIAVIYAGLGNNEEALIWLARACQDQSAWRVWLKVDPRLDALRADPRFESLVEKAGLSTLAAATLPARAAAPARDR